MTKPHKRYSYWVFLLIGAIAGIGSVLPSLKGSIPDWAYAVLVILGVACQYIKQEGKPDVSDETSEGS